MSNFARQLIRWHKDHGRHDLPWQGSSDPYRIWLSEIMLQQTQVKSVIPYYQRFLDRFPDLFELAAAQQDEVLAYWSGLGYYSRARNLHHAAQLIVARHGGVFPREFEAILALPGIGRSTAAAIAAFAFGARHAILDGNVKRVLARYFAIDGYPGEKKVETLLWQQAEELLPHKEIESYTQAMMDLGATVCVRSRPNCAACPLTAECLAHQHGRQSELPHTRPRKALPQREVVMLLLLYQEEIFLEKRPPAGIWGGMWSFPEMAHGEDVRQICRARFACEVASLASLPVIRHTFTHFRLHITPQIVTVAGIHPHAGEEEGVWLPVGDALAAGIPAPVRKLLGALVKCKT